MTSSTTTTGSDWSVIGTAASRAINTGSPYSTSVRTSVSRAINIVGLGVPLGIAEPVRFFANLSERRVVLVFPREAGNARESGIHKNNLAVCHRVPQLRGDGRDG